MNTGLCIRSPSGTVGDNVRTSVALVDATAGAVAGGMAGIALTTVPASDRGTAFGTAVRRRVHAGNPIGVIHVHALVGPSVTGSVERRQAARRSRKAGKSVTGSGPPNAGTCSADAGASASAPASGRCIGDSPALIDTDIDAADLRHVTEPVAMGQIEKVIRRPVEVIGEVRDLLVQLRGRPDQDSPRRSPAPGPCASTWLIRS